MRGVRLARQVPDQRLESNEAPSTHMPTSGYRWLPLRLDYALTSWRILKQAGRTALILGALRNAPLSFVPLPKLDVVGSSPIARSVKLSAKHLLNWPAGLGRPF